MLDEVPAPYGFQRTTEQGTLSAMALTLQQEWTLVACAWVAHADDVLEVGEWDLMIRLLESNIPEEDEAETMAMVMDKEAVQARFDGLTVDDTLDIDSILEIAWTMALADGASDTVEADAFDAVAGRLGKDAEQAAAMRASIEHQAHEEAGVLVAFAAGVVASDGRVDATELVEFDDLISSLPVPESERENLVATVHEPPAREEVTQRFASLDARGQRRVLARLGPLVAAAHRGHAELMIAITVAVDAGMTEEDARAALDAGT